MSSGAKSRLGCGKITTGRVGTRTLRAGYTCDTSISARNIWSHIQSQCVDLKYLLLGQNPNNDLNIAASGGLLMLFITCKPALQSNFQ